MKFTDNQIHFIKKEVILNFINNNNFYVKIGNNFVFVNNKKKENFIIIEKGIIRVLIIEKIIS